MIQKTNTVSDYQYTQNFFFSQDDFNGNFKRYKKNTCFIIYLFPFL